MFNFLDISSYTKSEEYKSLLQRIEDLENQVKDLSEKYKGVLRDIKHLEEENIDTTNELYRLENSLDARIDILAEKWMRQNDL